MKIMILPWQGSEMNFSDGFLLNSCDMKKKRSFHPLEQRFFSPKGCI